MTTLSADTTVAPTQARKPNPDRLAALVRFFWCLEIRSRRANLTGFSGDYGLRPMRADGGMSPVSGRYEEAVWPKVAARCIKHNLDPIRLVRAAIASCKLDVGREPFPQILLSDRSLEAYYAYSFDDPERVEADLKSYHSEFDIAVRLRMAYRGLEEQVAVRQVLRDGTLNLSPLFRYGALMHAGFRKEAAAYEDQALVAYILNSRAYDKAWGSLIPEDLRRRAADYLTEFADGVVS